MSKLDTSIDTLGREQLSKTPEKSDRQIAAGLGVHHTTVSTQRKDMVSGGEISHLDTAKGYDGKEYPRQVQRKPVSVFNPTSREEKAIIAHGREEYKAGGFIPLDSIT